VDRPPAPSLRRVGRCSDLLQKAAREEPQQNRRTRCGASIAEGNGGIARGARGTLIVAEDRSR
jgi:hypothetical protein